MKAIKGPVRVFLCPAPLKIGKGAIPVGVELGSKRTIQDAHVFQAHPSFDQSKKLIYLDDSTKKIVRKYGVDEWGRIGNW